MSQSRSEAAHRRSERDGHEICPHCDGSGLVVNANIIARARKGGLKSLLRSFQPGELSMSERGRRGGRPKEPTIDELIDRDRGMGCP